jgi:2-hydroxychromene-2-carboxylate isomerase
MAKPTLDFWFEFASTYSYPAAMRISPLAEAAGVAVRW